MFQITLRIRSFPLVGYLHADHPLSCIMLTNLLWIDFLTVLREAMSRQNRLQAVKQTGEFCISNRKMPGMWHKTKWIYTNKGHVIRDAQHWNLYKCLMPPCTIHRKTDAWPKRLSQAKLAFPLDRQLDRSQESMDDPCRSDLLRNLWIHTYLSVCSVG